MNEIEVDPVTRASLLGAGLTPAAIEHRLAAGRLRAVHRGVYTATREADVRERAALLAAGRRAVLSHRSAAVAWGVLERDAGRVQVTVPGARRRARPGMVVHACALTDDEVCVRDGLLVTVPARTLHDLAATHPRELARAVDEALLRRLVEPADLVPRPGRRGAGALRALLAAGVAPTRSEAERRLLELVERAGLPRPQTNVRLADHEVDALWRAQRLVVEVDGHAFHGSRAAFERDRRRDADLLAAGHRVLRVTWRQLEHEPERIAARLGAALGDLSSRRGGP
jgi:very-short-patch-repair endonuclease